MKKPPIASILFFLFFHTLRASTFSVGGEIHGVGAVGEDGGRRLSVRTDFLHYTSNRTHVAGFMGQHQVKAIGTAGVFNGDLTNSRVLARALRTGLHGHFYENTWFDLHSTPRFVWGEIVSHDPETREVQIRVHRTHYDFHLPRNPPVTQILSYDRETRVDLEGMEVSPVEALRPGSWVQVHPPRGQIISLRTLEAVWDPSLTLPWWLGRRGSANNLTAPARVRGMTVHNPDQVYGGIHLEVSRLLGDEVKDRTFRGSPGIYLDGRAAPASVALRPGGLVHLMHYRDQTSPHKIFARGDSDTLRGLVGELDADGGGFTFRHADPLTGEPLDETIHVSIDPAAVFELDGLVSSQKALREGLRVNVFPARPRTLRVFAVQTAPAPAFVPGVSVGGQVGGTWERAWNDHPSGGGRGPARWRRHEFSLGHALLGATSTEHRRLFVALTTEDGAMADFEVQNYAHHGFGKAWDMREQEVNLTEEEGHLRGDFTLHIEPQPVHRPSPVRGGRYHFDLDARIRANHIQGEVTITHEDGEPRTQAVHGRSERLPRLTRVSPANAVYTLHLETECMTLLNHQIALDIRNGTIVDAVAIRVPFHRVEVDAGELAMEGDSIRGQVRYRFRPDQIGLPGDRTVELTTTIDVQILGQGALAGEFYSLVDDVKGNEAE